MALPCPRPTRQSGKNAGKSAARNRVARPQQVLPTAGVNRLVLQPFEALGTSPRVVGSSPTGPTKAQVIGTLRTPGPGVIAVIGYTRLGSYTASTSIRREELRRRLVVVTTRERADHCLKSGSGSGINNSPCDVNVLRHRDARVAQLVGNGPRIVALVERNCGGPRPSSTGIASAPGSHLRRASFRRHKTPLRRRLAQTTVACSWSDWSPAATVIRRGGIYAQRSEPGESARSPHVGTTRCAR